MKKRNQIHENEIFRFFECKLTVLETSQICDVDQKTVTKWDNGSPIPHYYRIIMKTYAGLELDHLGWAGWKFHAGELISPMGWRFKPEMLDYMAIMQNAPERREDYIKQIKSKKKKA